MTQGDLIYQCSCGDAIRDRDTLESHRDDGHELLFTNHVE